jgi:hypothetical protein
MKKSLKIPKGGNQNLYEEEQTTQWPKEKVDSFYTGFWFIQGSVYTGFQFI